LSWVKLIKSYFNFYRQISFSFGLIGIQNSLNSGLIFIFFHYLKWGLHLICNHVCQPTRKIYPVFGPSLQVPCAKQHRVRLSRNSFHLAGTASKSLTSIAAHFIKFCFRVKLLKHRVVTSNWIYPDQYCSTFSCLEIRFRHNSPVLQSNKRHSNPFHLSLKIQFWAVY